VRCRRANSSTSGSKFQVVKETVPTLRLGVKEKRTPLEKERARWKDRGGEREGRRRKLVRKGGETAIVISPLRNPLRGRHGSLPLRNPFRISTTFSTRRQLLGSQRVGSNTGRMDASRQWPSLSKLGSSALVLAATLSLLLRLCLSFGLRLLFHSLDLLSICPHAAATCSPPE